MISLKCDKNLNFDFVSNCCNLPMKYNKMEKREFIKKKIKKNGIKQTMPVYLVLTGPLAAWVALSFIRYGSPGHWPHE